MTNSSILDPAKAAPPAVPTAENDVTDEQPVESLECKPTANSDPPRGRKSEVGLSTALGQPVVTKKELWSYYSV